MKTIINYSGIPALILMAALFFLPFSCSKVAVKENPDADSSSQLIKISGEDANAATKTTLNGLVTSWVITSDKVGIYSPDARPTSNGLAGVTNRQFSASTTAFSSTFTAITGEEMYWGTATLHRFYAYYPYSASAGTDATVVPITLTATQTQSTGNSSSHLSALDFLVATPKTVVTPGTSGNPTTVDLRYNHVFTVLEFQIKGTGQLKAVKLSGSNALAFSGGTIDITQTTPETGIYTITGQTGINHVEVTLTTPAPLSTTTTTVYMVINPGTQTGNCSIGLSSDGTTWTNISKEAPSGGFLRGKKYVVSIEADQDGNFFSTVTIGTQTWMAENLKTTKYNNGTNILNVTDNTLWGANTAGAYCWYNNDENTNKPIYGALYNWHAVNPTSNGGKNICPVGWHIPTDDEWDTLTDYLGGVNDAGGKLKETGYIHWNSPNTGATNSSGFTALPGGYRSSIGTFYNIGNQGDWWTSYSDYNATTAYYRDIYYGDARTYVWRNAGDKLTGFSVRCVKGETSPYLSTTAMSAIASNSAISGGEITSDGGSSVTARGVCWSTAQNPTTSNTKTTDGSGIGSFTSLMSGLTPGTTYYVRAYATNSIGTTYGTQISFITGDTVSDKDGNTYNTVTIGTQLWMKENLKTTKYLNGESIGTTAPANLDISNATTYPTPKYQWAFDGSESNVATYGRLYTWYAATDSRNICPTGWHLPTGSEWTTLTNYLVSEAGGKLKETGTSHWYSSNSSTTNSSGFTALPGGYRYSGGAFSFMYTAGEWWSSTEEVGTDNAWSRYMSHNSLSVESISNQVKKMGFSVRCIKE